MSYGQKCVFWTFRPSICIALSWLPAGITTVNHIKSQRAVQRETHMDTPFNNTCWTSPFILFYYIESPSACLPKEIKVQELRDADVMRVNVNVFLWSLLKWAEVWMFYIIRLHESAAALKTLLTSDAAFVLFSGALLPEGFTMLEAVYVFIIHP